MTLQDVPESARNAQRQAMYRKILKDSPALKMRRARGIRLRRTFPRSGR